MGFLGPASVARAALPVPITAQEALPSGVPGHHRSAAPVTAGVPLAMSDGITSVDQLGLAGADAAQFRELARWPNGNLKWVLVDYPTDVPAGGVSAGVSLTRGAGDFGGPALAVDQGASILVSTGSASFTVRKSPFRFFDNVTIAGTPLLAAGGEGLVVVGPTGVRYASANDAGGSVVLEENGPVRSVIRASGTLRDRAGARMCDYLVRLHFYRGASAARAWVSLRNARPDHPAPFSFRSAEVVLPLALSGELRFVTETTRGSVTETLGAGETAYLFQGYSTHLGSSENAYAAAPMAWSGGGFLQTGVEVRKAGGPVFQALSGDPADHAHGWAALEDAAGRGLTMGMRMMAAMWPAGFEVSGDGVASVELFSKRNAKAPLRFAWGAYETRELWFDFHDRAPANRRATRDAMEYPVVGRAALAQIAAAGGIYGETGLVSPGDQRMWFAVRGGSAPPLENIRPEIWRYHAWGAGGGGNQTDFALLDLVDFLRTGHGGFFIQGERNSLYKADTAVRHSDGYDYTTRQIDPGDEGSGANQGAFNGRIFDHEHGHWISLPIAYFLTGNELFREAAVDYGEWKRAMGDGETPLFYSPVRVFGDGSMRVWSRYYRDFALLWDVTRDARHWSDLDAMTTMLLASRDAPGSALPAGRSLDRGYMWMAHGDYALPRRLSDFMTVQIHAEAVWEAVRLLRERDDPRTAALEDYLLGLADFIYGELYFETGPGPGQYGYLYSYHLDQPNNSSTNSYWAEGFRPISSARPLAFAYQMTGDVKYLNRAAKLLVGDVGYVTKRTPSDLPSQAFMALDLFKPQTGWLPLTGVVVTPMGSGSYQITFTAPQGATAYRIKAADKPIVPWLGFDQATRAYSFPPAEYVPWFAAEDVPAPPPASSGLPETITLTGLDPARPWHFAIRYRTAALDPDAPAAPTNLIVR